MGRYLVLALKSQVIILDLDEQYVCYFEKMVMGILGAIYDLEDARLFYTATDNRIYELDINTPKDIKSIVVQSKRKAIKLYGYITGSKEEVVLEVDRVLYAYDIAKNSILFSLP